MEGKSEGRGHRESLVRFFFLGFFPPLHFFFLWSCWISGGSSPSSGCGPGLELGAGWWLGGGHDLHVLGEDGLERLVPVDHGAEHQWLKETEASGYHHAAAQAQVLAMSFLNSSGGPALGFVCFGTNHGDPFKGPVCKICRN